MNDIGIGTRIRFDSKTVFCVVAIIPLATSTDYIVISEQYGRISTWNSESISTYGDVL